MWSHHLVCEKCPNHGLPGSELLCLNRALKGGRERVAVPTPGPLTFLHGPLDELLQLHGLRVAWLGLQQPPDVLQSFLIFLREREKSGNAPVSGDIMSSTLLPTIDGVKWKASVCGAF